MAEAVVLVLCLITGFAAGLLTFRRSLMWCQDCGETLSCPRCSRARQRHG